MYIYIQEIRCSQIVMGDHWQGEPPARRAKTNGPPTNLLFFSTAHIKKSQVTYHERSGLWFHTHIYIYMMFSHVFYYFVSRMLRRR